MSKPYILTNDLNSSNYFINFLQLFFFNKPLYSFFNVFCKNGKKGLTLKLVLLLLSNLKSKTSISPIIILKSVILNNKFFFKVNETKFRKRAFYSVSYLDLGHQVSFSVGSLNRYLKEIVSSSQSDLVDTLSNFFLSFFFKDDFLYKDYIRRIIIMNENINQVFSNLDRRKNRFKSTRLMEKSNRLYLNTLFGKHKVDEDKFTTTKDIQLANTSRNLPELYNNSKKKSRYNKKNEFTYNSKDKGNLKVDYGIYKYDNMDSSLNNFSLVDNDFSNDPIEHLDLADIKINQYFKNYSNLKNKIIYFFLTEQFSHFYTVFNSIYTKIFNSTMDTIFEESLFDRNFSDEFIFIDENLRKKVPTVGNNFVLHPMEYFMLRLVHVEVKYNLSSMKTGFPYDWMIYESQLLSYVHRYYFDFHKSSNNLSNKNNRSTDEFVLNNSKDENITTSIYRRNISKMLQNYIKILTRVEREKKKRKELAQILKLEEEGEKLFSNIKNSLKAKVYYNISKIMNTILPYLIKRLRYNLNTLNYKKNRKHISYKFKRSRVIGYY